MKYIEDIDICSVCIAAIHTHAQRKKYTILQYTATYCNTLQHNKTRCNLLQHALVVHAMHTYVNKQTCMHATHLCKRKHTHTHTQTHTHTSLQTHAFQGSTATNCSTLQHTASRCNTLQHNATHYNTLQYTTIHYDTLHHTATHYNTLQRTAIAATHCNTHSPNLLSQGSL